MREFMIGMITIGLVAGIAVGRTTERARRSYKDYGAAKAAVPAGRKVVLREMRKAAFTVTVVAAVMVALFVGTVMSQQ